MGRGARDKFRNILFIFSMMSIWFLQYFSKQIYIHLLVIYYIIYLMIIYLLCIIDEQAWQSLTNPLRRQSPYSQRPVWGINPASCSQHWSKPPRVTVHWFCCVILRERDRPGASIRGQPPSKRKVRSALGLRRLRAEALALITIY